MTDREIRTRYADIIADEKTKTRQSDIIEFAICLTGHDRETIIQMYNDWNK